MHGTYPAFFHSFSCTLGCPLRVPSLSTLISKNDLVLYHPFIFFLYRYAYISDSPLCGFLDIYLTSFWFDFFYIHLMLLFFSTDLALSSFSSYPCDHHFLFGVLPRLVSSLPPSYLSIIYFGRSREFETQELKLVRGGYHMVSTFQFHLLFRIEFHDPGSRNRSVWTPYQPSWLSFFSNNFAILGCRGSIERSHGRAHVHDSVPVHGGEWARTGPGSDSGLVAAPLRRLLGFAIDRARPQALTGSAAAAGS